MKKLGLFLLPIAICLSCTTKEQDQRLILEKPTVRFSLLSSEQTGIDFINEVANQKDFNIFTYRNFYNGGGVAIGDINNDGLPDIYLTSNFGANKLYLNKGNFRFDDISASAGVEGTRAWSTGVVMVDLNADGQLDIYVCNSGNIKGDNQKNELFLNNGDLTFTESAAEYNLAESGFTSHAAFLDFDLDGDLDVYLLNNSFIPVNALNLSNKREVRAADWNVPDVLKGGGDKLMRNDNGKFVDVSEEAGIYGSLIGFGLGVTIGDINGDFYPDMYISNDFYEQDYLYINQKNGSFKESIKEWTQHTSLASMGADMQDINNDGLPDIFVTDMLPEKDDRIKTNTSFENYDTYKRKENLGFHYQYMQNSLQLNTGNQHFAEIAYYSGVAKTDWSWGALLFDMDNDGYKDIYVCNGIYHDLTDQDFIDFFANEIIQKMILTGKKEEIDSIINKMPSNPIPNYAFKNNGDLTFSDYTSDWGLSTPSFSNGAAYADLDNDGDLDLVVNNVNQKAFVFKNQTQEKTPRNFIKIALEGKGGNTFGVGVLMELFLKDKIIRQELNPSRGFQSSTEYVLTFGVGDIKEIDSLSVHWNDNKIQTIRNIEVNKKLTLKQSDAKNKNVDKIIKPKPLFKEISGLLVAHKENNYSDFDYEGLITKMLSQEGPALAVADVDGDGNEDIFIGGAKGQPGIIYQNKGDGNLKRTFQKSLETDSSYEDTAASFFDADGDGDMDLMVGSGGNEVAENKNYRPRLYINDGKGVFTKTKNNLPSTFKNISVIAPYDFDSDGDMDVFIGSRSVVGNYGIDPDHLFLENTGDGSYSDATERLAYDLKGAGMLTDAVWADIDGDGKKDLITVSDWGTPKIYKNSGRRLVKLPSSLDSLNGWWNTIEVADLDGDGDNDLILGNQGSNTHYKTSEPNPMKMWINDFDGNGTLEQIITQNFNGRDYPLHQKKELTAQLISLKKQNLKASEYAKKTIEELFSSAIFKNSIMKQSNIAESVIAIQEKGGKFTIKKLPYQVQLSCVCGISCTDVNNDGNMDIILGGNNFEFKPQYSRLDANYGSVLLGDGKLGFKWQDYNTSGFFIRDEIKHLGEFKDKSGKRYLIAAINDTKPKIFALNE